MGVYPVVLCGGAGVRLWPASQPENPKPFLNLFEGRSLFQAAIGRALAIPGARPPIVIGHVSHADHIAAGLAEIGVKATVLLEPDARETAAAVGVLAAWIAAEDPQGVAVMIPSDHYIPDEAAFAAAVGEAVDAARQEHLVTLGLRPAGPSTAYGYIRPGAPLAPGFAVAEFTEKPDAPRAAAYIAAGYLWNSGNLIARADILLAELDRHAPDVSRAARRAVSAAEARGDALYLSADFQQAPRTSFDYAVMEKTHRAAVIPVDFEWSDLGAWDAVWAVSEKDADGIAATGDVVTHASRDCLVRAPGGMLVTLLGVENIAVVVENGVVLVTAFGASQKAKDLLEKVRARPMS